MSKIKFQLSNDEYEYQNNKNVLPISDIPLSLIPKGPPKTGEIYLRLVHEEAKKCPKVVRKPLPESKETVITKETKNVNYLRKFFNKFEEEEEKEKISSKLIPIYLKPSEPWKEKFIKEFEKLRNIYNTYNLPNDFNKESFPSIEDESNWKVYLYGKSKRGMKKINSKLLNNDIEKVEENIEIDNSNSINSDFQVLEETKKRKLEELVNDNNKKICIENDLLKENNKNNIKDIYIKKLEGRDPLLIIIKQMNQKIINKLLLFHSIWIKNSISKKQYQWIYSLLVGLDPLLTSSQVSILRDICKLCKSHREQIFKDTIENCSKEISTELDDEIKNKMIDNVAPLNIIITIITVFFSQSDLE